MQVKPKGNSAYLPVAYMALTLAVAATILPTALRPPATNPPTSAQLSPDAPPENSEVILSELARGTSSTAGGVEIAGIATEDVVQETVQLAARKGACFGNPPRQVESLYAPPCAPAYTDLDNGGATHQGVTANEIRIAVPGESRYEGPIADTPGVEENTAQRTRRVYQAYFNKNFELYGRRLQFYVIAGAGASNVIKADEEYNVFAIVNLGGNTTGEPEAIRRGLVYWGGVHNPKDFFRKAAPYAWSFLQDGTTDLHLSAELICKQLQGKPVSFSGDAAMQGQPRKFGGVFYDAPPHPNAKGITVDAMREQCGAEFAETVTYNFEDQADAIASGIAKLRAAGVTTIFCWCDYLTTITWTRTATNQAYFPEWMTQGGNTKDQNANGRTYDQTQWGNSIHLSASEIPRPEAERDYYRAYKSIDPGGTPSSEPFQGGLFYQLLHLVGGIQLAGPKLTPETFREGMFKRWPRRPPDPPWSIGGGYGPDDYTYGDYAGLLWWDPDATDPLNGNTGAYRWVWGGKRFTNGELPTEPIPWFEEEGTIMRAPPRTAEDARR